MTLYALLIYFVCLGCTLSDNLEYFLAVSEIEWDYAPDSDISRTSGSLFGRHEKTKYKKAVYREYTDATFTQQKPHNPALGILGPTMQGYINDYITVHFKNLASRSYSLHVQGDLYYDKTHTDYTSKDSEGAQYGSYWLAYREDTPGPYNLKYDEAVPPNGTHTYKWRLSYDTTPYIDDDRCIPWLYYSHTFDLEKDVHSGPVGVVLSCTKKHPLDYYFRSERSKKANKTFVAVLQTFEETKSWYASDNGVAGKTGDAHTFHTINGYSYGNLPGLKVCSTDMVLWYIAALGSSVDVHSFSINGHVLNQEGSRVSSAVVMSGVGTGARMVAQEPGTWLIHDLFHEHFQGGLHALLTVEDCGMDLEKVLKDYESSRKNVGQERKFYITAEEMEWDYAPSGQDKLFNHAQKRMQQSNEQIGTKYKKALYVEYTDDTFTQKKTRPEKLEYMGLLGPLIMANIEDTVTVVFKNLASRPYSMHVLGLKYGKDSEGFGYNDQGAGSRGDSVSPGDTYTYRWSAPSLWGPTEKDAACVTGVYHSAVDSVRDVHSGLVGPVLLCDPYEEKRKKGSNSTISFDDDFFLYMTTIDENKSWYIEDNIKTYAPGANKDSVTFRDMNKMYSVNGYIYGNMPVIQMCQLATVQFSILTLGGLESISNVYFHSHVALEKYARPTSIGVQPGHFRTVELTSFVPGTWLIESLGNGQTQRGMGAFFKVLEDCVDDTPYSSFRRLYREQMYNRTFYIAAEEVEWDYAPLQYNFIRDEPLWTKDSAGYKYASLEGSRMGTRYKKAIYRAYTDETFSEPEPVHRFNVYRGLLGPVIQVGAGSTVKIVFRNKASRPYSIHAVGVQYNKSSEGYAYGDQAEGESGNAVGVPPGGTRTYHWYIPKEYAPSFQDYYCASRLYYSAVDPEKDVHSGLVGPLVVCQQRALDAEGIRTWPSNAKDTSRFREFHLLFHTFDENKSWYFKDNVKKYGKEPVDPNDEDFRKSNMMHSINGRIFGNLEGLIITRLSWADFYLLSVDEPAHPHSVHFHGAVMEIKHDATRLRKDTLSLFPGSGLESQIHSIGGMKPGTWLVRSGMVDQYEAGMAALWHCHDIYDREVRLLHQPKPWHHFLTYENYKRNWFIVGMVALAVFLLGGIYCVYKHFKKKTRQQDYEMTATG